MRYAGKKILTMCVTLFAVTLFVFLAFHMISGDPVTSMLGTQATPERAEALREELGLNDPVLVQYGRWAAGFLKGDMGTSYSYRMPVSEMILDKLPVTITMTLMAFAWMILISIPVGLYAAKHEGGMTDRIITVVNQIIMAVPPFFAGILITFVFGMIFRLFTPGGYVSYQINIGKFVGYLFFPSLAIALPKAAMAVKLLRSSVISEMKLDYVRTAYSRGNSKRSVLYRHVLKNAMIPVITFLGMALSDMIAGSIIIEQVFGIPGLGRILLTSISNRDYPVVMAVIVCIAALVLVVNMVVDVIYGLVDPRISVE
ncbi:MAG: ABC transporter permease [Lachnospiraceae bacterium]|jgi:peptide/nickel ABC transporter permease protein|uniref:ABC transporter permease n=1 Tax=Suilimivivens aceti TaxID=2981774 RepID=A0ABT2T1E7_9FIRM|nr:ABC transporter permease [Suilimivivens aceti]MCU6744079.1 ABC transporter permease [Suilimivivens aceti]SCH53928.1 Glutathione transport system permease protein gsiC [uncultured Clostridium sp.]